jgi:DNA-binding NarL/FixJ family response regulator
MTPEASREIVLVVDDSPATLSMLTAALEEAGMTVLVATEGAQALAMVDKVTPDVILMDAVMPDMDGFRTTNALKANKNSLHVPVIFMTGLSDTEHVIKGFQAGGIDYVTKPIVPDELIARIRVHVANARQAQSARTALDASGRYLLAANRNGKVLWCTPQASKLLSSLLEDTAEVGMLPDNVRDWLQQGPGDGAVRDTSIKLISSRSGQSVMLTRVGAIGADEYLLRLKIQDIEPLELQLRQKFSLTTREAEVLRWIAEGKSNRDVASILDVSPRTVNKHLEQIFTKLGVENRTAAAAVVMRLADYRE